jgi:hypothetical protein
MLLIKGIVARLIHRYGHSISAYFEHLRCEIFIDRPDCRKNRFRPQTAQAGL